MHYPICKLQIDRIERGRENPEINEIVGMVEIDLATRKTNLCGLATCQIYLWSVQNCGLNYKPCMALRFSD